MTPNNNLSVLPFYEGIQYQDYKKSYAYGDVYPLFTPINKLLPFKSYVQHVQIILFMQGCTIINLPVYWQT